MEIKYFIQLLFNRYKLLKNVPKLDRLNIYYGTVSLQKASNARSEFGMETNRTII